MRGGRELATAGRIGFAPDERWRVFIMVGTFPGSQEFVTLRDAMNQLLEDSFTPFRVAGWPRNGSTARPLPIDVYATPDDVVLIAAVPGARPEDVEISINQGTVTLTGKVANVADATEAKGATWYLHELWHGRFQRTVTLPVDVDASKADATFADGVLRLRLPKAEQAKPRRIEIRTVETRAVGAGAEATPAE
jgi:HSP20 family protein